MSNGRYLSRWLRRKSVPRGPFGQLADGALAIALLGFLVLVAARWHQVSSGTVKGIPRVLDGDTLLIADERIRLSGIDAPERQQICTRDGHAYECGEDAAKRLVTVAGGRTVECETFGRDHYGRLLGKCRAGDTDLGAVMVDAGWAIAVADYEQEESEARVARRGVWAGEFDPPEVWRQKHGQAGEQPTEGVWLWFRRILSD